ncbi:MAG: DUF308 domain-containing protein [Prevotella sp.]|jgi:uncharacterized membrane protein HdeD (DUF308 family)|nr:DUF308 domain-containing protein [Prevotella sp.]MCI1281181.1 DUF308 domain-containing protein [Prevotella sp.]
MKVLQSSIFRALCAIIVGALLIEYREDTVTWLAIAIGALFFISGVISIVIYYSARKHKSDVEVHDAEGNLITEESPAFPIVGLGSLILGVILAFMPATFIVGMMYILAAILVLGAISQYVNLALARKFCHVGWFFWLAPTVILLAAIFIMVKPMQALSDSLFFIGWCMLVYGVVECMNALKIHNERKRYEKAQAAMQAEQQKQVDATAAESESVKKDETETDDTYYSE